MKKSVLKEKTGGNISRNKETREAGKRTNIRVTAKRKHYRRRVEKKIKTLLKSNQK